MLTFSINNAPLLLDDSTSIQMTWRNPACNINEIPGDRADGISIDNNKHNLPLMEHPNRFEKYRTKNIREFDNFEARYSGYLLQRGTFVVNESGNESTQGWLRSTLGNLGKKHRERFISDIEEFTTKNIFISKANYDPDTDPYACPKIFNPLFFAEKSKKVTVTDKVPNPNYIPFPWVIKLWGYPKPTIDTNRETEEFTEAFRMSSEYYINFPNEDGTVALPESFAPQGEIHTKPLDIHVVSPMLFLNYVLKYLFLDAGLVINDSFLKTNTDLKKLILYNNFDITKVTFGTKEVSYIGEWELGDIYYNKYWSEEIDVLYRAYNSTFQFKDLLPKISLKDFLVSIQNLLNVCFHLRLDNKVDIIDRESILTEPAIDISEYLRGEWEMKGAKNTTLKFSFVHDENDMKFKQEWNDIDDLREWEGDPVEDWDELIAIVEPELGEVRYITSTNQYARYDYIEIEEENPETGGTNQTDTIGWICIANGLQNGYYNRGQEEEESIETKFSTLMTVEAPRGTKTCWTEQKGNMRNQKYAYENFSPRLMFYLRNNRASAQTTNIAIDWEKQDIGLLETRWKNWGRFWVQREAVERKADIPINILDYILRNITKKFRSDEGEFIIEEIKTEFKLHEIAQTTITGYKIGANVKTMTTSGAWRGRDGETSGRRSTGVVTP